MYKVKRESTTEEVWWRIMKILLAFKKKNFIQHNENFKKMNFLWTGQIKGEKHY